MFCSKFFIKTFFLNSVNRSKWFSILYIHSQSTGHISRSAKLPTNKICLTDPTFLTLTIHRKASFPLQRQLNVRLLPPAPLNKAGLSHEFQNGVITGPQQRPAIKVVWSCAGNSNRRECFSMNADCWTTTAFVNGMETIGAFARMVSWTDHVRFNVVVLGGGGVIMASS